MRVLASVVVVLLGGLTLSAAPRRAKSSMSAPCTVTITPADTDRVRRLLRTELPTGAVLCLAPGIYETSLDIFRSMHVRGAARDQVIVRGGQIANAPKEEVTIESLTFCGGEGAMGANLPIYNVKAVRVRDVTFRDGVGGKRNTGAVSVDSSEALFENCLFRDNASDLAQAIDVHHGGRAMLRNCTIIGNRGKAPAILATWGGRMFLERSTVVNLEGPATFVSGPGHSPGTIEARNCILRGQPLLGVSFNPQGSLPKTIIEHSLISEAADGVGVTSLDNVVRPIELDQRGRPLGGFGLDRYGAPPMKTK